MVKVIFVVWNSQFVGEAVRQLVRQGKLNPDEVKVKDVQSINWKNDCEELLRERADLYVIYQMGKGDWEEELAKKARILAFKSGVDSLSVVKPEEDLYKELYLYLAYDGMDNLKNFVLRCVEIAHEICGRKTEIRAEKPVKMPWSGIYHPDCRGCFESYEDYERWYFKNRGKFRKKAGLLFYRARYLFRNTSHVDLMIKELESRKIMPIPVFCLSFPDKEVGMPGVEYAIEKYFLPAKLDIIIWGLYFRVSRKIELLRKLNVPVLNAIELYAMSPEDWAKGNGINPTTLSMAVAMPEFDGAINPIVFSGEIRTKEVLKAVPIEERVRRIAEQAERWIKLREKENEAKKVAVILHGSATGNTEANSGTALGLDSFESVVEILKAMKERGYLVEIPSKEKLVEELKAAWRGNWSAGKGWIERGIDWYHSLPESVKAEITEKWGELETCRVPGVWLGNVFVTVQPPRCEAGEEHKLIHDPVLPPPPCYLAFYSFINSFDAVLHVGKHGSVEWLPGKSCGLSETCYPDVCLKSIPNAYIYIVNNPAEGTQAKRRGYSTIIDHLPPVMESAELYKELEEAIEDYFKAKERGLKEQLFITRKKIIELAKKHRFLDDEGVVKPDFDDFARDLHSKVQNFNCSLFNLGLHTFGVVKDAEKIALAAARPEIELEADVSERKKIRNAFLKTLRLIPQLSGRVSDFKEVEQIAKAELEKAGTVFSEEKVKKFVRCILKGMDVVERLKNTREVENLLKFFEGGFVEPAPSGDITKGRIEVIPTGFNFYSVDPKSIPTRSAWEVGKRLADKLLKKYEDEEGRLPETVAFIQWTSDPMNTDGEQIAQILYTLGVEPVWDGRRVSSLKVIPLEELGRPRIDVFLRISGLFRDTFMNLVELVDKAVTTVASLDEPLNLNFVRKHTFEGVKHRIFGDMPGAYGAGVNHAVNSSNWESREDLAEVFVKWGMYAYGNDVYGEADREGMIKAMEKVEVVVRNHYTDEWDVFSDDCPYAFQGGLGLAVEAVSGRRPKLYISDTRPKPGEKERIVDVEEEVERVARITLLNDRWIKGMMKHGYKGAGDIMKRIVNMFGWEATADAVKDWIFEEVAKKYVLDRKMRKWFMENNPYAVEEIVRRLLEAYRRGLWECDEELIERIEDVYIEVEGFLEE